MLKVSHAKPLHDATALMADEARMRNRQSVHMARMRCGARDSAVLEGLVQRSLSLATDKVERILKMLESQSKTIYGKK